MTLLSPGDAFPAISVPRVGGGAITLPDDLAGSYGVILITRGAWCPFCTTQLSAFQRAQEKLTRLGVRTVSFSVDDEATVAGVVAERKLTFPVGYGAHPAAVFEAVGAFVNPDPVFLQSTGFVLDSDGRVVVSVYSSGAIGRLVPEDVAVLVSYLQQKAA